MEGDGFGGTRGRSVILGSILWWVVLESRDQGVAVRDGIDESATATFIEFLRDAAHELEGRGEKDGQCNDD